jgi:hypothetical protein
MQLPHLPRRVSAAVAVLALLLTAACSADNAGRAQTESLAGPGDGQASGAPRAGDGQASEAPPAGEVQADTGTTASEQATVTPDEPPTEPLATAEGTPPFAELEIVDLRRVGDTVTVEFAIITDDSQDGATIVDIFAAPEDQFGADGISITSDRRYHVSGVTLVDHVNRKRHLVLRDSTGRCLCTDFGGSAEGSTRHMHSAQFPAPPEDVDTMTVQVPLFPAVDNVPLRVSG